MEPPATERYRRVMDLQTKTKTIRYLPIPEELANEARERLVDRFGHRLHVVKAQGPCRLCLRIPKHPENLILLSYQPLPDTGPYAEIGPIFIHAERCSPYEHIDTFPEDFAARRLVVRAYGHGGEIVDASVAEPGKAGSVGAAFLTDERVAEVHVRHESYTCFAFKIVRAS
jgi:hypothetical protein